MQVPERVYMVLETRADGTENLDPFEFTTIKDAQERMDFLIKNAEKNRREGSSFKIVEAEWLHEV